MIVYYEIESIEADLGISLKKLYAVSNTVDRHYRSVSIPKKDGSYRSLSVPDDKLKFIQDRINRRLLSKMTVSKYATAYKYGSRLLKNASPHVGKKRILKLDISHFFDNIMYSQVKDTVFPEEYFSEPIRILLSILCYHDDSLPQGAPTSPAISNIIMRDFDEDVGRWCGDRNITYTRYCDDMTFSGNFDHAEVTEYVSAKLREMGFFLNRHKRRSVTDSQRQLVTGIVVNEKPSVPSEYRRKLRQELYYCKKFGIDSHMKRLGITEDARTYIMRLIGRVNFVLSVTPENNEFIGYHRWIVNQIEKL